MASSTPKDKELIVLIFAHTILHQDAWAEIFINVPNALCVHFGKPTRTTLHWLDPDRVAELRMNIPRSVTLAECKNITDSTLEPIMRHHKAELVLQPSFLYCHHKIAGLAVFDMDSTLIQQEVIDELARAVGKYDECAAITAAAMRGEAPYTDFAASLRARVKLLKDVPTSIWDELKKNVITFTPGARELMKALKALGWKTAVLSGGFMPLAEWVKSELGLDYALANFLVEDIEQGCLTGELVEGKDIVDGEMKRLTLTRLAEEYWVPKECIFAVGDGANDLKMMEASGLGIAFHAKPRVQLLAPSRLNTESLLDVLHILGYKKAEVDSILNEA